MYAPCFINPKGGSGVEPGDRTRSLLRNAGRKATGQHQPQLDDGEKWCGSSPMMARVRGPLGAAVLSGLGGILLEMNYTSKRSGSLLLINMQLSLVSLPFALLAVFEFDWPGIAKDGWHKGLFRADTMAVILVQVCALRALLLMAPDGQRPRVILDHVSWWLPPCLVTSLPEARK